MLGHASAAMTLGVYAGFLADNLDEVADRLSQAFKGLAAERVRGYRLDSAVTSFDYRRGSRTKKAKDKSPLGNRSPDLRTTSRELRAVCVLGCVSMFAYVCPNL
jgi:hypothetical protein